MKNQFEVTIEDKYKEIPTQGVSYTHMTLQTSDL